MIWAKSFLATEGDDLRPARLGPVRVRSARAPFGSHKLGGGDGTSHPILDPLEFLETLAAIIP
jgi:hypothetical protein